MFLAKYLKKTKLFFLSSTTILSGCKFALLDPKGQVGLEERSLILTSFSLMLIVIIPVVLMAIGFAWKYRLSAKNSVYNPDWSHSSKIESIIWIIPILIILFLAKLAWKSTHFLEPSKPVSYEKKPISIDVISMDWKWLFIYPEEGIAVVNEIAFPINTPIKFRVTSNSVMNSFFIPRLGSQIYAMAGMQTNLYLIANEIGIFDGISSNYSGSGFFGMKFKAIATPNYVTFEQWIKKVKRSPNAINNILIFEKLATPSVYNKVEYFSSIKPNLFEDIIHKFTR